MLIESLLVLLGLALVAACGGFVAAEFALVTVDRATVERSAATGDKRSQGAQQAMRTLSTQLSGAQLGITVTNLAIGFLAEPAVAGLIDGPLAAAGVPEAAVPGIALTIGLTVATAVTMVYGELVPKNLAIARPLQTARAVQGFQRGFTTSNAYTIRFLNGTANAILRRFGIEPQEELASARSPEELVSLVRRSAEKGTLAKDTATLLVRSLAFSGKRADDVLTPRVRVRAIRGSAAVADVIATARETGHSRFPVIGEDLDDIVGAVHVKHAVSVPEQRRSEVSVREVMVPPVLVPTLIELDPLLETLRRGGLQMGVVIDEFGGTAGIVTMEDLVEELVGDIADEHDRVAARIRRRPDGSWLVSGLLRPDEIAGTAGIYLPEDDTYETLGGLVGHRLGRVPATGDVIEVDGIELTVDRMDGRRVDRVLLRVGSSTDAGDEQR
ncbi:hemolysin family protein [soil metagenome]